MKRKGKKQWMYKNNNSFSENEKHRGAKYFMRDFLISKGWKLKTNTINGEYWINQKLDNGHRYRLDGYFVSPEGNHYSIEYDGLYHFSNVRQYNKMLNKDMFVEKFFKKKGININIVRFTTDELHGRAKLKNEKIYERIENGLKKSFLQIS